MATKTETIFVIYKYDEYVGEGTKEELEEKTGLRAKYIEELSCPSKKLKKWQVVKVSGKKDQFADFEEVDYAYIKKMMSDYDYNFIELADILGVHPMTVSGKVKQSIRFRHEELEELEDLFFLKPGALLRGEDE